MHDESSSESMEEDSKIKQVESSGPRRLLVVQDDSSDDDHKTWKNCRDRGFVFTVWASDLETCKNYRQKMADELFNNCRYAILGIEVAPTTGRHHIQGYALWANPRSFNALRKVLLRYCPEGFHLEPAKGKAKHSEIYCSKDGDAIVIGTCPKETSQQGRRTDLERVVSDVKSFVPREQLAKLHPEVYVRYHAGFDKLCSFYSAERERPVPFVFWLHGPSGSGKTRWATEFLSKFGPGDSVQCEGQFVLGLRAGTKSVLLDDFRPRDMPFNQLLRFTDRYKVVVNVKGGHEWLVAEYILISCIFAIDRCFNGIAEDLTQLKRRVTKVISFPLDDESDWPVEHLNEETIAMLCDRK